jgi:hypothetical protein
MGRPPAAPEIVRRNRVVTMVTDGELRTLSKLAHENNRSLSAIVHQILSQHLNSQR